jgi:hypothetical protein
MPVSAEKKVRVAVRSFETICTSVWVTKTSVRASRVRITSASKATT